MTALRESIKTNQAKMVAKYAHQELSITILAEQTKVAVGFVRKGISQPMEVANVLPAWRDSIKIPSGKGIV